jgi:Rieske Fe-S protein
MPHTVTQTQETNPTMATVDLAPTHVHDDAACVAHPDGTRRRALLGGIVVAAGAVCAGCSSSKSSGATAAPSTTTTSAGGASSASTSTAAPTTASSSASGGSDTSSTSSGAAGALAATSSVPVGGGTILTAQKIVLTQPAAGTFKAFTAVCTHMGCLVSTVSDNLIHCPCHGSAFHVADGSVANGPAPQPLAEIPIKVANGEITQS